MADLLGRRTFVGRGAELARLESGLQATLAEGTGRTIVVGGEAGIGKSWLVDRFAASVAASGRARVLEGACLELSGDALPYAPFVEILRELVRDTPPERLPAVLGPGRAELTRLLPELAVRAADLGAAAEPERASQARLFELLLGVFERLASERALLLIVEDVHWADRSTCDLLGFLARALRDAPVLLLVTTRTEQDPGSVRNLAFLAELEREDHVERIELRPFERDEVAEQAAGLLDDSPAPSVVDALLARSDGNPFYVEELILAQRAGETRLPPVLRDVIASRVAGLSARARDVLRAAAAAGRRIDDELLAGALGIPVRELAPALREALDSGILVRLEGPGEPVSAFRHALLHEAVDAELFAGERIALHAAFALALEGRLAEGDRAVPAVEVARHWDAARDPRRALPFTLQAASEAEGAYGFAEAATLWERAATMFGAVWADPCTSVDGCDAIEALLRAAECAVVIGDPGRAVGLAQRALALLGTTLDRDRTAMFENRLRWYLWWSGERAQARAALELALAEMPADARTLGRAHALAQQAGVLMFGGDYAASAQRAQEAIAIGEELGERGEIALAYGVLGWDLALMGDVDAGIAMFRRAQAIAEGLGSVEGVALAATQLAALMDRLGDSGAALQSARDGYALTERYGVGRMYGSHLLGYAAKAELALGRWDDADRSTSLGLRRGAIDTGLLWLQVNRARLLVGRGRFAEAEVLLRRAKAIDERLGPNEFSSALLAAEAELAAWAGRYDALAEIGDRGLAALAQQGGPDPSLAWLAALVLRGAADQASGVASSRTAPQQSALSQVAVRVEAAAAAASALPAFASGDRAQALVALLHAEAQRLRGGATSDAWAAVAERFVVLGRPFHIAYARLRQAEAVLATHGDREVATGLLAEAAGIAADLRAEPLAGLVTRLATQARLPLPGRDAAPAPSAGAGYDFTPREAEVLRLVAAGWTNQQIADHLFITRKTASVHVSNILGKLGVTNRAEAAALAHRLGLATDVPLPVGAA